MPRYKDVYELAHEVGGMYALVVGSAKRAKQLREGRQSVVKSDSANPLTVALHELLDGHVVVRPPGAAEEEQAEDEQRVEIVAVDGTGVSVAEPEAADADGEAANDDAEADE